MPHLKMGTVAVLLVAFVAICGVNPAAGGDKGVLWLTTRLSHFDMFFEQGLTTFIRV